uniref:Vitelline membrane outer layer 1 homolog n=1 Tax=Pelodiscus sinensis TaxID=13735 RepID=K7F628_PELSI|nr:vitelline membrane outer layer protein 1 homolog isoform X1 [Pelodiscus sinensis]|eukprot:XP_006114689.1 vitelline membrane outer layer protein 1 homolog isoform X1 [Pelodiscus sinensis]
MDISLHATLVLVLCGCLQGAWGQAKITVSNGGKWGTWGPEQSCPKGSFADGFAIKVQTPQLTGDDTALNGIRLSCSDGTTIQSNVGPWGHWSQMKKCPPGKRLTQFRLRVEKCQGLKDDTAANNIKFYCTDGTELQGAGRCWGTWGPQSLSCGQNGICSMASREEAPQEKGDNTALNDVYFKCCSETPTFQSTQGTTPSSTTTAPQLQ